MPKKKKEAQPAAPEETKATYKVVVSREQWLILSDALYDYKNSLSRAWECLPEDDESTSSAKGILESRMFEVDRVARQFGMGVL